MNYSYALSVPTDRLAAKPFRPTRRSTTNPRLTAFPPAPPQTPNIPAAFFFAQHATNLVGSEIHPQPSTSALLNRPFDLSPVHFSPHSPLATRQLPSPQPRPHALHTFPFTPPENQRLIPVPHVYWLRFPKPAFSCPLFPPPNQSCPQPAPNPPHPICHSPGGMGPENLLSPPPSLLPPASSPDPTDPPPRPPRPKPPRPLSKPLFPPFPAS